jgi:hypothetical protein
MHLYLTPGAGKPLLKNKTTFLIADGFETLSVRNMKLATKTPSQREGYGCLRGGGEGFRRHFKQN